MFPKSLERRRKNLFKLLKCIHAFVRPRRTTGDSNWLYKLPNLKGQWHVIFTKNFLHLKAGLKVFKIYIVNLISYNIRVILIINIKDSTFNIRRIVLSQFTKREFLFANKKFNRVQLNPQLIMTNQIDQPSFYISYWLIMCLQLFFVQIFKV